MKKILLGALLGMMLLLLVAAAPDDTTLFGAGGNSEFLWWSRLHQSDFDNLECMRIYHDTKPVVCATGSTQLVATAPGTITRISSLITEAVALNMGCIFTWRKNGTEAIGNFSVSEISVDATDLSSAFDSFYANVSTHLDEGDYIDIAITTDPDSSKCTGTCICTAMYTDTMVNTWFIFD